MFYGQLRANLHMLKKINKSLQMGKAFQKERQEEGGKKGGKKREREGGKHNEVH